MIEDFGIETEEVNTSADFLIKYFTVAHQPVSHGEQT